MMSLINGLRCRLASWLLKRNFSKNVFLATRIAPDTTSLIRHRQRRPVSLPLPPRSHLIYHQETVDGACAQNSLETLLPQIPDGDEVFFLDVGQTLDPSLILPYNKRDFFAYHTCRTRLPEHGSYTFGLNAYLDKMLAPVLFVWRTDYMYPPGVLEAYLKALKKGASFASPYEVRVGLPYLTSTYARENWNRTHPWNDSFWNEASKPLSLYETQDPALFAMDRVLWQKIGGLDHNLWGYGWQFAELAARVRCSCPASRISYFKCPPPLHQTHSGSLMHQPDSHKKTAEDGRNKFQDYLGGKEAYEIYRLKQNLPPTEPA